MPAPTTTSPSRSAWLNCLHACVPSCAEHPTGDDEVTEVVTSSFRLDLLGHRAFVGDREARLTPTEWAIAEYLARLPGRLVTYRQLITAVWGPSYDPDPNLLRVHMGHIRRKLEVDAARPTALHHRLRHGIPIRQQQPDLDASFTAMALIFTASLWC